MRKGSSAAADRQSRSISYRIAMLLRIPEVAAVRCEPPEHLFRVRFLVAGAVPDEQLAAAAARLHESLIVLAGIDRRALEALAVEWQREAPMLAAVEVVRDAATLGVEEIVLATEVLRDALGAHLVADGGDPWLVEEETAAQEEAIFQLLRELRQGKAAGALVAIREEGRVYVYSQSPS